MRIGQLATKTGVSARMLRHYEKLGLITPERLDNGYRDYGADLVDRVEKISNMVAAGIPVRIVGAILPCLDQRHDIIVDDPAFRAVLVEQLARMTERAESIERNRAALASYIEAIDRARPSTS
ncbi:MerR family DNA-binding transcriptional regulator [Streptomyces muensis]|uniref:MerR family DNA-binding transcriptional regulator n=1 Tax=Streptomyces muensis TaxID=1077944 RepID=A0A9X1Q9L7_STRM4|nr:MerR family DNA-binding transcriptional regulator [Streptomyces muensis]MCF1600379.1 MerR family DNA-binding transcriptional regulator [Streptomyces muensis]